MRLSARIFCRRLMNLGYHRPLAERAVDLALNRADGGSFESTLRHALRELREIAVHLLHVNAA